MHKDNFTGDCRRSDYDTASFFTPRPASRKGLKVHSRLSELIEILDLEQIEENVFRGQHQVEDRRRLYGGQIMAQALVAAGRTVDATRPPHSLHGYFMRPGDPSIPVLFSVERIRDGRSFSTRRIVAIQHGKAIFSMDASFQEVEKGLEHFQQIPDVMRPVEEKAARDQFITFHVEYKEKQANKSMPPRQNHWFKSNGLIASDNRLLHAALLTFQSDDALLSTSRLPHLGTFKRSDMQSASLDHAMWFHDPDARVDHWILYSLDAPLSSATRGYNRGAMFSERGHLIASAMQESLMRLR